MLVASDLGISFVCFFFLSLVSSSYNISIDNMIGMSAIFFAQTDRYHLMSWQMHAINRLNFQVGT